MNKSRRFGWLARTLGMDKTGTEGDSRPANGRRSMRSAARLAAAAGEAMGAHTVEQLEARQLLFTVSIGPGDINPATGLGTRTVDFSYVVPYLAQTTTITPVADTNFIERFDDEMQAWVNANPPVPPNGTQFDNSRIQLSYSTAASDGVRLLRRPTGPNQFENALRLSLTTNDTVTFTIFDPVAQMDNTPRLARRVSFSLSSVNGNLPTDGDDLNTNLITGTRVELLDNGVVVRTFRGAELEGLRQGVFVPPLGIAASQFTFDYPPGFDAIRFRSAADAPNNTNFADIFVVEEISVSLPGNTYAAFIDSRVRDVRLTFTGPAGATAQVLDLYDRDMQQRAGLRIGQGAMQSPIDRNNDGVPDFNDGIGRVVVNGTNGGSSLTMVGYIFNNQSQGAPPQEFPTGPANLNEIITGIPFGFEVVRNGTQITVVGLPPVGVSLVLGSPFVRDNSSAMNYLRDPAGPPLDFNRTNQGVFVTGGASLGNVLIMGAVFGSSRIDGAASRFSAGFMAGSLRVDGDLGSFISQTDNGAWWSTNAGALISTQARITIGRTAREIDIAGRNLSAISVLADVNNTSRARITQNVFQSRELVYGFTQQNDGPRATILRTIGAGPTWATTGQAIPFGAGYYRNDSISSAEFVGYNGTSVRVIGSVNGLDPVNTAFDSTDVYAFPADATREVVIAAGTLTGTIRVVDRDGRVIAALDATGRAGRGPNGNNNFSSIIRFTPTHADTYYLVINNGAQARTGTEGAYEVTVSGMAPVTMGAFRTGTGSAANTPPYVFTLAAGDMGSARIGTGYFTSGGSESNTAEIIIGAAGDVRDLLAWRNSTISTPGTLFNVFVGGNINGAQLLVRGDLGTLITGAAGAIGRSVENGDMFAADIRVGGSIAVLDINGCLGVNQVPTTPDQRGGAVSIITGTVAGRRGDIGQILVGGYMSGSQVSIRTSPGSQFDQFIIGANNEGAGTETPGVIRDSAPFISVGDGSDVRFFSFARLENGPSTDVFVQLTFGQTISFVDDAGATVTIGISGGTAPIDPSAPDPRLQSAANIRTLSVNGSRGVAIARITTQLLGGANLVITGLTPGVVSIGRIIVVNATSGPAGGGSPVTPAPNPNIIINGVAEIDVNRIDVLAGTIDQITNTTTGGDLVAIDASSLRFLTVFGNLGRTQTTATNRSLLGPFLGVDGAGGAPGAPIGIDPASINISGNWNGGLYDPVTNPALGTATGTLEQIGSPVDPYLNGVIVRAGDLENVSVRGSVGDVLVQNGHLINLVANADGLTPQGGFEGIVGNVYAVAIGTIDVGDGLLGTGPGPLAQASILADTSIVRIIAGGVGGRITGARLQGIIVAAGGGAFLTQLGTTLTEPIPVNPAIFGIGSVEVSNGRFDTMLIYAGEFDDFWQSTRVQDFNVRSAIVHSVRGINSDLFRSEVVGAEVQSINLTGGAFDASLVESSNNIGTIIADEFRNSTRLGAASEFYRNLILATNNLGSLTTNGLTGDISDLTVDLGGSLTGQIAARNIQRSNFSIVNITSNINAVDDIRSVSVESGRLTRLAAGQSIRSTSLRIAGPVESVTAGHEITRLLVNSSGPDGRVDLLRAQNLLSADVTSSGSIGTIQSVTSDVRGTIVTRNDDIRANNGGLTLLSAGRDLLVSLSILGDTGAVTAVGNIGLGGGVLNPDLDLRGNVGNVTATNGQIYSDILIGQSVTGAITTGRVWAKPDNDQVATSDILVFGRINALVFNSDFNGNITSRSGGIGSITFNRGSFRPGHAITVNNGDLGLLQFNGGDLLGDVFVDGNIGTINVLVGSDGFKGQIGIASWRRNFRPVGGDPLRNELPPGVARSPGVDGVTIKAGGSIERVFVERGSMTESQIIAGTTINTVFVGLQFRNDALSTGLNNAIVAGDRINSVVVGGFAGAVAVLAGVIDLGADGRVGGIGDDADTVKSGSIGSVNFNGPRVVNSIVTAGVAPNPGTGKYNQGASLFAAGRSNIDQVTGNVIVGVHANAAGTLGFTSPGIVRGLALAPSEPNTLALNSTGTEVELAAGVAFLFQLPSGERGQATLNGPGRAFYDPAQGRLRLSNTTSASSLTIVPNGQFLTGLTVLGNASSALARLNVGGTVRGASSIFINGDVTTIVLGNIDAPGGLFGSGGNVSSITTGNFLAGALRGRTVGSLTVAGDLGRSAVENDAFVDFLSVTTINVTGAIAGAVSSDRGLPTLTAGSFNNGGVRSGLSIGSITTGSMLGGRISARTTIGNIVVNGDATSSQFLAGADLGRDANYGGTGRDADVVGSGALTSLRVNGNFRKSDVGAGVLRGPSGYLGNTDVVTAAGRSSIGSVIITGVQTGSTLNSEQFRVLSTGTITSVTVGGAPFTGNANFKVERIAAVAVPVRILDLFVTEASRIYTASIVFNQPVDVSTLSSALSVVELRSGGATTIGLAEGSDYSIQYDKAKNTVKVIFSRNVTERGLPQTAGIPAPGVYQFILSAAVLRGSTQDSRLDGNADGSPGDDFSRNAIVGDAGDKITAGRPTGAPAVSFYGPTDLDLVLRRDAGIGSLPDVNTSFTLRGSIGDHPNTDPDLFRLGGDVDVYRITLRAGQVLRLGQISGTALGATRAVFNFAGAELAANSLTGPTGGAPGTAVVRLPNNTSLDLAVTSEDQYLITQTGTYFIVMAGLLQGVNIADTNSINNADPVAGAFGLYAFSVVVFDDSNTGFVGDTAAGTASPLITPPVPQVFAGVDMVFGTADDLSSFTQSDWVFTLQAGPGGPNSASSVVRGVNSQGWTVTRSAAPNGTFGSANDRVFTSIKTSIGLPGATGTPNEVSPDVDIFALNGGQPIAPGTKMRATLRLTATGSNIGLSPEIADADALAGIGIGQDLMGHAQFALFETPSGTGFNNARLVAAPSDFLPIGGQPQRTLSDGRNAYGYDANGDFFMEFVIPGAQGITNPVPASYALYIQGAIRSDYTLEIVQQGTGSTAAQGQNVLLETNGGTIDWLEAGDGLITSLSAFTTTVVGFTGQINGQDVDTYVINNLLANLNAIFTAANVGITLSTNPNNFAHQSFSTVILAGNVEPNAFFGNATYGASQKVDFFNVDKNDQAVVFVSSLAELGFEPSDAGVDRFISALTGAVARRIGELVGVRFETSVFSASSPVPVMAANSVAQAPIGGYGFTNEIRSLAGLSDNATNTVFYLGTQNAGSLIQRVVVARA